MNIDSGRYKKLKTNDVQTKDCGMYASVAKDLESLFARQRKMLEPYSSPADSFKEQTKTMPVQGKDQCQIVVISDSDEEDDGIVVFVASNDGPKAPEKSHCLYEDDKDVVIDCTAAFEAKHEPMGENSVKAVAGQDDWKGGISTVKWKQKRQQTKSRNVPTLK
ncbi:hypothetical protein Scep_016348 [Stephania cephalantha]|uniref:Uncharacterized protein n=1 Tax=Stephania cephalantha TaxID=152367 RepID=A0AAP0NUJ6_9MAGN